MHSRGEPVLHDINLHIRPGEKVGICGKTGRYDS
jgi:ABC-type multidrug transport system fused ATPase/permease subunit